MNLDLITTYLLLNNSLFQKYQHTVDLMYYKLNSRELFKILSCLFELKEKENKDHTVEELMLFFYSKYPALKKDDSDLFTGLFNKINELDVSLDVAEKFFTAQEHRMKAAKIAEAAIAVVNGQTDFQDLIDLVDTKPSATQVSDFVTNDLATLYESTKHTRGLRWPLRTLNLALGSLREGDFGFIMARPETGKTTFVSFVATYMTEQHDGNTLWINNEERGTKVKVRNFQSLLGKTSQDLFGDIAGSNAEYLSRIGNRLHLYDDAAISTRKVEQLCDELQPKLIIIDQLDKIKGIGGEGHGMLKEIYQWARELAKKYNCPVIGVSQAGATAEDKLYLDMNDIDGSKTGKPGEADWIIGIGATANGGMIRGISVCKNKLSGDDDSLEAWRHAKYTVQIRPDIAQYEDFD